MRDAWAILGDIEKFVPEDGNWLPLDGLLDELWRHAPDPAFIRPLLGVFERFPDDDGAGVFWSIVHGVEGWPFLYEDELRESLAYVPSEMGAIMMARVENSR